MFNRLFFMMTIILCSSVFANDIYIEQVGDSLDLDITQDGQEQRNR